MPSETVQTLLSYCKDEVFAYEKSMLKDEVFAEKKSMTSETVQTLINKMQEFTTDKKSSFVHHKSVQFMK